MEKRSFNLLCVLDLSPLQEEKQTVTFRQVPLDSQNVLFSATGKPTFVKVGTDDFGLSQQMNVLLTKPYSPVRRKQLEPHVTRHPRAPSPSDDNLSCVPESWTASPRRWNIAVFSSPPPHRETAVSCSRVISRSPLSRRALGFGSEWRQFHFLRRCSLREMRRSFRHFRSSPFRWHHFRRYPWQCFEVG